MKYELFRNPSAFYCFTEGVDVRTLYIENNIIVFECCKDIENISEIKMAILNLDSFEYEELFFDKCEICEKKELTYKYEYKVLIGAHNEEVILRLNTLLEQINDVENIFDETYNGKNDLLKTKKNNMEHYQYSEDKTICKDIEQQKSYWFDFQDSKVTLPENAELAFVVSEHKIYKEVLKYGFRQGFRKCLENVNIHKMDFFNKEINHVYIGNDFCINLFPNEEMLSKLINQAYDEKLGITISYPPLIQQRLDHTKKMIRILEEFCREKQIVIELVVNDWGMIQLLKEEKIECFNLVLGRLLNKRKKDSRMKNRMGYEKYKEEFGRNNLCSEPFSKIMDECLIRRCEFEANQFFNEIPDGNHTLHFPFYQTNTASNCLIYANCKNKSVIQQEYPEHCPHYCSEFYFSFPKHLDVIGKNNSLFVFDKNIFLEQKIIDRYVERGINRFAYTPL